MNALQAYLARVNMPRSEKYRVERNIWMVVSAVAITILVAAVAAAVVP